MGDRGFHYTQLLRLYAFYTRLDFLLLLRDVKISILYMATDLMLSVSSVSSVFLLSQRFDGISDMSGMEVLFMLGIVTIGNGLIMMTGANNVSHISRRIGRGQVDHMLIQPVPLWAQCMAEGFSLINGLPMLLCGVGIMIYAVPRTEIIVTPGWIALLIGLLALVLVLYYSLMYLFSAGAFWAPNALEEVSSEVNDFVGTLRNYPLSSMPKAMRRILTTALPAGLFGWAPAMLLLGSDRAFFSPLLPILVTGAILALAILAMWKGWENYGYTGSKRYSNVGFRR